METEDDVENVHMNYIRMKVEVNNDNPLMPGFWWRNSKGKEQWANIKYERLSDYCYGCGKLEHTTQECREDVIRSEDKLGLPMYEPGISGLDLNHIGPVSLAEHRLGPEARNIIATGNRGMTL